MRLPDPSRRTLAFVYLLALIPALATALLQPVWSIVDEADHFDLVAQYAAGHYPRTPALIQPETLQVSEATDTWGYAPAGSVPHPITALPFATEPVGIPRTSRNLWVKRHYWQYSKEVGQAPLYYVFAVPFFVVGDGFGGAMAAVFTLRVLNALIAALVAPFAMMFALRLWPLKLQPAYAAAAIGAFLPGPLLDLSKVTSDTLAIIPVAACLLMVTNPLKRGPGHAVFVGAIFGAACLVRPNSVVVWPALALGLLMQSEARWRLRDIAAFSAAAALVTAPWFALNYARFHELTQFAAGAAWWPEPPPAATPTFWGLSTIYMIGSFFSGEPFGVIPGSIWITVVGCLAAVFAAAGLLRAARIGPSGLSRRVLAVFAIAGLLVIAATAISPIALYTQANGRYLYLVLPVLLALGAAGLRIELRDARIAAAATGLVAVISIALMANYLAQPRSGTIGPGVPVAAITTNLSAQGGFGPLSISATRCAVDRHGDVWIEVRVANSGAQSVDWTPAATISTTGAAYVTSADYSRSTQFPGTVQPHQVITGWLWLGHGSTIDRARPAVLTFHDVAALRYGVVGDAVLPALDLC